MQVRKQALWRRGSVPSLNPGRLRVAVLVSKQSGISLPCFNQDGVAGRERLLLNGQSALEVALSEAWIAQCLDEESECVERLTDVRVRRAQPLLLDGKRPLENQPGFGVSALMPERLAQAVQISSCPGMLAAERLFPYGECPP